MHTRTSTFTLMGPALVGVAVAMLLATPETGVLQAQAPAAQDEAQDELLSVRGELVAVDLEARMLSVQALDGEVWAFTFTDDTQVQGGESGTEGLATMTGAAVTVHYAAEGEVNLARIIEIASEA